jgi:adenine nucleotide transporter 17
LLGFIAGIASRAISTPLAVVTVRLQTAGSESDDDEPLASSSKGKSPERPKQTANPLSVVRDIYSSDGLSGFWKGLALLFSPDYTAD